MPNNQNRTELNPTMLKLGLKRGYYGETSLTRGWSRGMGPDKEFSGETGNAKSKEKKAA